MKLTQQDLDDKQKLVGVLTEERLHTLSPLNVLANGNAVLYGSEEILMQEIKNIEKIGRQCLATGIFLGGTHEDFKTRANYLDETFVALLKLRMFDKKQLAEIEKQQKARMEANDFVSLTQVAETNLIRLMGMGSIGELDKHLEGLVQ